MKKEENPMKTERSTQKPSTHLPPHHFSETLKNEMAEANKKPLDPNSFLVRLPRR
jgi:hypothetical protein